jgi:hypothetical protein
LKDYLALVVLSIVSLFSKTCPAAQELQNATLCSTKTGIVGTQ